MINKKKLTINYVNNERFRFLLEKYQKEKKLNPNLSCPDEIGTIFMTIAKHYITKWPSTISYMYKEDMQSYGVEYCLRYMDNYNSILYDNPFSYFTQIIKTAFMQLYNHEKKKRNIVKNASEKMSEEKLFIKIKNNVRTYREFNNPIDSQIETEVIEKENTGKEKKYILWEDELIVENLNTNFLSEFFKEEKY